MAGRLAAWFEGGELDVAALGEEGEAFAEIHGVVSLDEGEDIAPGAADEAVEYLLGGDDAHGGGVVVVEGAEADILPALGFEGDAVADDSNDIGRVFDALDIIVWLRAVHTHAIRSPPAMESWPETVNHSILALRWLGDCLSGVDEPRADRVPRHPR